MNTLQNINLMKNKIILFLMISFALTSCKNEVEPKENTTRIIPFTEVGMKMREEAAAKAAKKDSQTATNTTAVAVGMNPAHGQKGHRCDIPVGAPLNSPAVAAKTTTTSTSAPQMTVTPSTTSTATPITTAEGMNPPHGQEGHRCDIAVGAALPKE